MTTARDLPHAYRPAAPEAEPERCACGHERQYHSPDLVCCDCEGDGPAGMCTCPGFTAAPPMTRPLTPESEALLADVIGTTMALHVFPARLAAIEAAVRADATRAAETSVAIGRRHPRHRPCRPRRPARRTGGRAVSVGVEGTGRMIAWAGACVWCRRAIQTTNEVPWWVDADGKGKCVRSLQTNGGHEPEVPPVIDDVTTDRTTDEPGWVKRQPSAGWQVPEGWRFENLGQCRTCATPVAWCWTPAGNRAPVEKDGAPHFARCPQASQHRRKP